MAEVSLLERLRACELLSAEQLAELEPLPEAANPDPKALARVVFQRGWLTKFQLSQVAAGKGKDLFVGPYVMLDRLGEGGMGQVLKARHRHMKRVVALKLIRKEKLGGADNVARFYQEVEAAAQLHHPNIVLAFDAGQAGGTHFFAMEYVEGPDLTRLVREKGTLPVAQACEFVRQAAVGLQHAHERGLVHRDIKPSNLLVTASAAEPVVKILDLGLARLGDTFAKERNLTKMGQVIGTPDYLAPEQALDARNVDIRADIYSLGCSLYFLLAARAPFQAESLTELLMKHQMDDPAPIRSLRPDVPPALEAVLRRMMAKKAQDRFDTPAEVAAALEPFARGESVGASAQTAVSIAAPTAPRSDETWAGLSNDAEVVARPKTRTSRSRDTIDEEPRPRRKKEKKGNKRLLIGGGIGAGVLLALIVGGVALLSPSKPAKVVENKPPARGTQGQQVPPPEVVPPVQPIENPPAGGALAAIDRGVRQGKMSRTPQVGGGDGGTEEYADLGANGALLTGLEVGVGKWGNQDVVHYLRPVYQTGALGPTFGAKQERTFRLEAKPGYAIGGITINAGSGLDGLSITFMAIKGAALDPADSYSSDWVGGKGGNPQKLGGDGSPVVGLFGKLSRVPPRVANGLGLVMLSNGRPAPVTPAGDAERLIGGGFGGEVYRDVAPAGGLLVGLEVGLGKFGQFDVTQSLRTVFRTGDKETLGPQRGTKLERVTRLVAKEGYAVGAVSVRFGANADGLSLTFMRVKGDALDPADSYESEWVGDPRPQTKTLLSGGGRPVVGLAIKANATDVTGYGLLLRPGAVPAPAAVTPPQPEAVRFIGHTGAVYRVAVSPDGKLLLSCGEDCTARLWDAATGKPLRKFYGVNKKVAIRAVCFTRDGEGILGLDAGMTVYHWKTEDPGFLTSTASGGPRPPAGAPIGFALSGSGDCLGVASGSQLVPVRLMPEGKLEAATKLPLRNPTTGAIASAEGVHRDKGIWFFAGDTRGTVHFADLSFDAPRVVGESIAQNQKISALAFNTRTKQLISAASDKTIKVTPYQPGVGATPVAVAGHEGAVTCLAVSPDGKRFASGSEDKTVRVWDMTTLKEVQKFTDDDAIRDVAFSADGKRVYSAGKSLRAWALADARKE